MIIIINISIYFIYSITTIDNLIKSPHVITPHDDLGSIHNTWLGASVNFDKAMRYTHDNNKI